MRHIIELYNIILISLVIKYFSLFRTPTDLEMLFDMFSTLGWEMACEVAVDIVSSHISLLVERWHGR